MYYCSKDNACSIDRFLIFVRKFYHIEQIRTKLAKKFNWTLILKDIFSSISFWSDWINERKFTYVIVITNLIERSCILWTVERCFDVCSKHPVIPAHVINFMYWFSFVCIQIYHWNGTVADISSLGGNTDFWQRRFVQKIKALWKQMNLSSEPCGFIHYGPVNCTVVLILLSLLLIYVIGRIFIVFRYLFLQVVTHRDISPHNILIGKDGHIIIKGFEEALPRQNQPFDGDRNTISGSLIYCAPELIMNADYNHVRLFSSVEILFTQKNSSYEWRYRALAIVIQSNKYPMSH